MRTRRTQPDLISHCSKLAADLDKQLDHLRFDFGTGVEQADFDALREFQNVHLTRLLLRLATMQAAQNEKRFGKPSTTEVPEKQQVENAIAAFPATFTLRAFSTRTFRISRRASYYSGDLGVQLVLEVQTSDGWLDHSRCGIDELNSNYIA